MGKDVRNGSYVIENFGKNFNHNGKVAYYHETEEDVSSDNACFPDYQLVRRLVVTDESWEDFCRKYPKHSEA